MAFWPIAHCMCSAVRGAALTSAGPSPPQQLLHEIVSRGEGWPRPLAPCLGTTVSGGFLRVGWEELHRALQPCQHPHADGF